MFSALFAQTTTDPSVGDVANTTTNLLLITIPILVLSIIGIIGMWKLFQKAGQPGWAAIIPIYNTYILLKIADKPAWWLVFLLLSLIPFVGVFISLVFSIVIGIEVAKRFGKSEVYGAVLCGILGVGYLMLGFGSAQYQGPQAGPSQSASSAPTPPAAV